MTAPEPCAADHSKARRELQGTYLSQAETPSLQRVARPQGFSLSRSEQLSTMRQPCVASDGDGVAAQVKFVESWSWVMLSTHC